MSTRPPRLAAQTATEAAQETRRVATELEASVREMLPRHGIAGTVVVRGTQAELHQGTGTPVSVEVGWVLEQWALLPADMRERKVVEVARRLADAHHKSAGTSVSEGQAGNRRRVVLLGASAATLLVLGAVGFSLFGSKKSVEEQDAAAVQAAATNARNEAVRTMCESERANLFAGRPFGQFGLEGWVLELWLGARATPDFAASPSLTGLVSAGKLAATGDPVLDALVPAAELGPGFEDAQASRMKGYDAALLRLSGPFVYDALTKGEVRERLLVFTDGVAQKSGASMAALVARCAHLRHRDVGVWFRGADRTDATVALFYGLGAFAETPTLDYAKAAALSPASELDGLVAAAGRLDATALGAAVTPSNGTLKVDSATKAVAVTFPLLGYTTALKATAELAAKAGVAR